MRRHGRLFGQWMVIPVVLIAADLAGCAPPTASGVAGGRDDRRPTVTMAMVPLGSRSAEGPIEPQTEIDRSRCAENARAAAGHGLSGQPASPDVVTERYVQCMARQGYRCEDRSAHKACESAWIHPTATRAQWDQDSKECLRAAFTVTARSNRQALYIECMVARGYRADAGEPAGEAGSLPTTPGGLGSASDPGRPSARSVTAATSATPSATAGALKWPPVGASYVQSVRKSGSFGSGEETRTIKYLGEQLWQGNKVRAFSDGSTTVYVDAQRRMLARVNSSGAPIESFEPYFTLADWPLRIGKWWPNRYRYSDHERGRSFNNAQYDGEVEAYEHVRTRAGTFRSFRIALGGPSGKTVAWYTDALGLVVKTRTERFSNHYRGHGVIETEIISYDFKP